MSDAKVEVTVGENSVEVDPRFYRVAFGVLTMGLPIMDVLAHDGEGFISIMFPDSDSMEFFSSFLLIHNLFPDEDGELELNGSFRMEMIDGDLCPTYLVHVDVDDVMALETCLAAHAPEPTEAPN